MRCWRATVLLRRAEAPPRKPERPEQLANPRVVNSRMGNRERAVGLFTKDIKTIDDLFLHVLQCWDCSCHGSHFAPDGTVLNGPAVAPLQPVDSPAGQT